MNEVIAVLLGFALRIVVPVLVTFVLAYYLKRLDAQWQEEARKQIPVLDQPRLHCWEVKACSLEQMSRCPATKSDEPCWQVFRNENGQMKEECLTCQVFAATPVPVHS